MKSILWIHTNTTDDDLVTSWSVFWQGSPQLYQPSQRLVCRDECSSQWRSCIVGLSSAHSCSSALHDCWPLSPSVPLGVCSGTLFPGCLLNAGEQEHPHRFQLFEITCFSPAGIEGKQGFRLCARSFVISTMVAVRKWINLWSPSFIKSQNALCWDLSPLHLFIVLTTMRLSLYPIYLLILELIKPGEVFS